jgi:hypothetical protein
LGGTSNLKGGRQGKKKKKKTFNTAHTWARSKAFLFPFSSFPLTPPLFPQLPQRIETRRSRVKDIWTEVGAVARAEEGGLGRLHGVVQEGVGGGAVGSGGACLSGIKKEKRETKKKF